MDVPAVLLTGLWAGLVAGGLAVLLTAPDRHVFPTFLCGFIGRCGRDACTAWGAGPNWATVIAAALVALTAAAIVRKQKVAPVVLVCAVIPLGAAVAMFNLIFALMRVSSAEGEALGDASLALSANLGKVFTVSLAIALGLAAGLAIVRLLKRDEALAA